MRYVAVIGGVLVLASCAVMRAEEPGTSYQDGINEALRGHTVEPLPPTNSSGRCTEVAGYRRADGAWVKAHMRCR